MEHKKLSIRRRRISCRFRHAFEKEGAGKKMSGPTEEEADKHVGGRLAATPQLVCHPSPLRTESMVAWLARPPLP
jgi:hypothetical protein